MEISLITTIGSQSTTIKSPEDSTKEENTSPTIWCTPLLIKLLMTAISPCQATALTHAQALQFAGN